MDILQKLDIFHVDIGRSWSLVRFVDIELEKAQIQQNRRLRMEVQSQAAVCRYRDASRTNVYGPNHHQILFGTDPVMHFSIIIEIFELA